MLTVAHELIGVSASTTALRVVGKRTVAQDVCELALAAPDGGRLPEWTPGAHLDLQLPGGFTRQYSLCGDRWDPATYRVAVLNEPGGRGGSAVVHQRLQVGDLVGVGGPRNHFPLVPARHYLFVAGGIGITPILAMIRHAELLGTPWTLLYGGRTRTSMAFLDELQVYGERVLIRPQDEYGLLNLTDALAAQPSGGKVYCCGPAPLLQAVEQAAAHLPRGCLRTERFTPKAYDAPVRHTPFQVELARSAVTVTVDPAPVCWRPCPGPGCRCSPRAGRHLRDLRDPVWRACRSPRLPARRGRARRQPQHVRLRLPLLRGSPGPGRLTGRPFQLQDDRSHR